MTSHETEPAEERLRCAKGILVLSQAERGFTYLIAGATEREKTVVKLSRAQLRELAAAAARLAEL